MPEIKKRGKEIKKTVGDKVKENPGKTVVGGGAVVATGETARRAITSRGTKVKNKDQFKNKTQKNPLKTNQKLKQKLKC